MTSVSPVPAPSAVTLEDHLCVGDPLPSAQYGSETVPFRPHVQVSNLHFDVLILIFSELYTAACDAGESMNDLWPEDEQMDWYPDALASVCRSWRDAISSVSAFWTRLRIFVDGNATSPQTIRRHLTLSSGHPLDIYICRRSRPMRDTYERSCIVSVVKALSPEIGRWRTFRVDTFFAMSIPEPGVEICGSADQLIDLRMQSLHKDGLMFYHTAKGGGRCLHTPMLKTIHMDGDIFYAAYLFNAASMTSVTHLTISEYVVEFGLDNPFCVSDLVLCLHSMPALNVLILRNLELNCDNEADPLPDGHGLPIDTITFDGVDMHTVLELYYMIHDIGPKHVDFRRCSLDPDMALFYSHTVYFEDMPDDMPFWDILVGFNGDHSYKVSIVNCPSFDPDMLAEMSYASTLDEESWWCPKMTDFVLRDCPDCSGADVRQMVEARRTAHAVSGFANASHPQFVVTSIDYLEVTECGTLEAEDRDWLDANVDSVKWDSWKGGCGREAYYYD